MSFAAILLDARAMAMTLRRFPLAASRVVALVSASVFDAANGIEPRFQPQHLESVDGGSEGPGGRRAADGEGLEKVY